MKTKKNYLSIILMLFSMNLTSCDRDDLWGILQTPDTLPVMTDETFDYADGTNVYAAGLFTGTGATVEGGAVSIPSGAIIISKEFKIPAIIEGTATIYPTDYALTTQQQNRFMVARYEVFNSQNLPYVFSFDIVNNPASTEIMTIVSSYNPDGTEAAPAMEYTGFSFINDELNINSVTAQRFRFVLNNTYQEFYIYDTGTSAWVMVRREEYSLTSDVWWHFQMEGVNNVQGGTVYPHKLDSLKISTIESGNFPPET